MHAGRRARTNLHHGLRCLPRAAGLVERKPLPSKEDAKTLLFYLAHEQFVLPGQPGFVLGGLMTAPASPKEAGET